MIVRLEFSPARYFAIVLVLVMALLQFDYGQSRAETTGAFPPVRPLLDSLATENAAVHRFVRETFGYPTRIEFDSTAEFSASGIHARETTFPSQPTEDNDSIWVYSPDRSKAVTILTYQESVDQRLDIFDRQGRGVVENLEFCGTPCFFLDVFWLDDNRFVIVKGWEHLLPPFEDEGMMIQPGDGYTVELRLYDLTRDSIFSLRSDPLRFYHRW